MFCLCVYHNRLVEELDLKQGTVPKYSDSQSAIYLTKNQDYHERTKDIDVRLHFIREVVASKKVKVDKISTDDNPANFLTKSVSSNKFQKCMNLLGVSDLDQG